MPILAELEPILGRIVAQPIPQTMTELQRLAEKRPREPGTHLAMAIVSSFARHDFQPAKEHLEAAQRLLGRGQAGDAEMAFAEALANVMAASEKALDIKPVARENVTEAIIRSRGEAAKAIRQSLMNLEDAARKLRTSSLAQTIVAMMLAFLPTLRVRGDEYQRGLRALQKLSKGGNTPDLASLFLLYAHRRARNYAQALRVGKALEEKYPNNALVKRMIGSCHVHSGDLDKAEAYFKQALALEPKNASVLLEMAEVNRRKDNAKEALNLANKAREVNADPHLAGLIKNAVADFEIASSIAKWRE